MKRIVSLLYGATALIGVNAAVIPQAQAQNFDWTGFYAGLIGGYGQGNFVGTAEAVGAESPPVTTTATLTTSCVSYSSSTCIAWATNTAAALNKGDPANFIYDEDDFDLADESWLAGFRVGADADLGGVVVGIIADGALTDFTVVHDFDADGDGSSGALLELNQSSLLTIRGRVGVGVNNILFYGTAGIAAGEVNAALTSDFGGSPVTYTDSAFMLGYAIGAGASIMVSDNIMLDFSYLHTDLGEADFSFTNDYGEVGSATAAVTNDIFMAGVFFKMP